MKKMILLLTLFILVYLKTKINSQDNCEIRYMFRKVKLSINELSSSNIPEDLIPFNLELTSENSNQIVNAYCYIEKFIDKNIKRNSYCYILSDFLGDSISYKVFSINSKYNLEVKKQFQIKIMNNCEYSGNNKSIFFRQVNNFNFIDKKGIFMFYAITKNKSYSLPSITFLTNIIYENDIEIREALCTKNSIQENESPNIIQIEYKCEIKEIENFKSLRILDSEDISGIPYDYNNILRDPIKTQKAIQEGILLNCNEPNQFKKLAIFNIKETQCMKNKGILTFIGKLNGEIKEIKNFTIFPSYLHKHPSGCNIPSSNSGNKTNMECILFNDISGKNKFTFEEQILTIGKNDILFNYEIRPSEMECEAMNSNLNLTFKDINSFKIENKTIKFNFIASTTQPMEINYNFILYLDLISKGTKEKELSIASCTNTADIKIENEFPVEVNFSCEILVENEIKYSSIKLSPYNYYIKNINISEFLIRPVINDIPKFNSEIIKVNSCHKLKEFTINGNFDGIINDSIIFEMKGALQLEYTSKCTLYKNSKDKPEIHCDINNNFLSNISFEQHVLKDQFIISNADLSRIECTNKIEPNKDDNENEKEAKVNRKYEEEEEKEINEEEEIEINEEEKIETNKEKEGEEMVEINEEEEINEKEEEKEIYEKEEEEKEIEIEINEGVEEEINEKEQEKEINEEEIETIINEEKEEEIEINKEEEKEIDEKKEKEINKEEEIEINGGVEEEIEINKEEKVETNNEEEEEEEVEINEEEEEEKIDEEEEEERNEREAK